MVWTVEVKKCRTACSVSIVAVDELSNVYGRNRRQNKKREIVSKEVLVSFPSQMSVIKSSNYEYCPVCPWP